MPAPGLPPKRLKCAVSGKERPRRDLIPLETLRPALADRIRNEHPDLAPDALVSRAEVARYRARYVEELLQAEHGEFSELDREVAASIAQQDTIAENVEEEFDEHRTLGETERAVAERLHGLRLDMPAMSAVQNLYRAAGAIRNHLERSVLAEHGLTWTGWVVLWVVWVWDEIETRHVAAEAGISKGTLTGVASTLESRGLLRRRTHPEDARRVLLSLTRAGSRLMEKLFPAFNEQEVFVTRSLERDELMALATTLRKIGAVALYRCTVAIRAPARDWTVRSISSSRAWVSTEIRTSSGIRSSSMSSRMKSKSVWPEAGKPTSISL